MLNNSFFKFLKMRFKSKKIEKTLITVKQRNSIRQTIALYEINRRIIFNQAVRRDGQSRRDFPSRRDLGREFQNWFRPEIETGLKDQNSFRFESRL